MPRRVECHVFAGLGGPFTAGGTKAIEKLLDALPSDRLDAVHHYHREWTETSDGIIARQRRLGDNPIVILIGHSYGAWKCQQIAQRLMQHPIMVAYIAGIDPTALPVDADPMKITPNVLDVDEFWSTRGLFNAPLWKRKCNPDGSRGGKYIYPQRRPPERRVHVLEGTGHIPTARHETTLAVISAKVRGLVS